MKYGPHCAAFGNLSRGFFPSSPWLEAGSEAKPEAVLVKAAGLDEEEEVIYS